MLLGNTIEYTHLIGLSQGQECVPDWSRYFSCMTKFLAPSPLVPRKHASLSFGLHSIKTVSSIAMLYQRLQKWRIASGELILAVHMIENGFIKTKAVDAMNYR